MRALFLFALCAAAGCTNTNACKSGTALLTIQLDATTAGADHLDISVSVDHGMPVTSTVPRSGSASSGSIEIDFPAGYPSGRMLTVSVAASRGGQALGANSLTVPVSPGCTSFSLTVGGGAVDMQQTNLPSPKIASTPDLVGFVTNLDGSGSTDPMGQTLTFVWSFTTVPTGSAVTDAALSSKTAVKPSFEPDLGGDYVVTLKASATDGRSATASATVTVPTLPIFHYRVDGTATTSQFGAGLIRSDGTGMRYVDCPYSVDGGFSLGTDPHELGFGLRAYDPITAGGKARLAFLKPTVLDGSQPPELRVADETTSCAMPPPRVDANMFNDHLAMAARFSPDGSRLAYIDLPTNTSMATYRLVTVSSDGTGAKHVVRSNMAQLGFTPPFWIDNNTVGWVESSGSGGDVFKAPDANGAGEPAASMRTTLLHCDPAMAGHLTTINQVAQGPFGLIVAGSTGARGGVFTATWSAMDLYLMTPGDCSTTAGTTKVLEAEPYGGESWDFSLSPDGLTILYASTHGMGGPDGSTTRPVLQHDLYIVPSDGSSSPRLLAGDPTLDDIEPRFIGNGRQITWTQAGQNTDLDSLVGWLVIANADGSHVRKYRPTVAGFTPQVMDTGLNRAFECDGVPGRAAGGGVAAALGCLAVALGFARRRARR